MKPQNIVMIYSTGLDSFTSSISGEKKNYTELHGIIKIDIICKFVIMYIDYQNKSRIQN